MRLRLARWFWNGRSEVELVVYFSSSVQICALIPVSFYSTCSKKKKKKKGNYLLVAIQGHICLLHRSGPSPPPRWKAVSSVGPSCRKLCLCTQKKKKKKVSSFFLQPAVWNFIPLGFKDLSLFCIFQFFFLLCAWAIRWSSATKAKKYTHSYTYTYIYIFIYIHTCIKTAPSPIFWVAAHQLRNANLTSFNIELQDRIGLGRL